MLRKYLAIFLAVLLLVAQNAPVFAAEPQLPTVMEKTSLIENFIYGSTQTGALVERIVKLETELWGKAQDGALMDRTDKLYSYCFESFLDEPSLRLQLNAVEWALTHTVTALPAKNRVDNLERVLTGNTHNTSLRTRMTELVKLAYANGKVVPVTVTLGKDQLVKIKLITPLSSKQNKAGDVVAFEVAEDLYQEGALVLAKGLPGTGKVVKVSEAKNFGRDAEMQVTFDQVGLLDGTTAATVLGDKAKEENKSLAMAAGASVAGMVILGPVGIVGGAFVKGKNIELPAGTMMYIQTKEEHAAFGVSGH